MAGKKGMKHYPAEMKMEAVRLFYEEGETRAEITQALGVSRPPHRVKAWLKQYRREGAKGFSKPKGRLRKQPESVQAELELLTHGERSAKKISYRIAKGRAREAQYRVIYNGAKNTK